MSRRRIVGMVATHALGAVLLMTVIVGMVGSFVAGGDPIVTAVPFLVFLGSLVAAGWLLAWRQPRNAVGWLLLAIAAFFVSTVPVSVLADGVRAGSPTLAAWLYWYAGDGDQVWSWIPPVWLLLIWLPLHYPDGALPSRRWRPFALAAIAVLVLVCAIFAAGIQRVRGLPNPTALAVVHDNGAILLPLATVLALATFAGTVISLVVRYRRGSAPLRAQLRWMLWSVAIAVGLLAISWLLPAGWTSDWYDGLVIPLSYALIPAAIGIAVLRYRLYEIDRIISRTAAYAIVTLAVVGTYGGIVLLAGLLLPNLESVGIALATLAAAAVFLPLLRVVRRAVDRVFNRAQYDAEKVVGAFGERIRTGVDPHTAGPELVSAVEGTLQPAAVGIWIREGES